MPPLEMASQTASMLGALFILVGYFGLQSGRLKESHDVYLLLNFLGGALLLFAAVLTKQVGFILLEGMWVAVTLFGWFKKCIKKG